MKELVGVAEKAAQVATEWQVLLREPQGVGYWEGAPGPGNLHTQPGEPLSLRSRTFVFLYKQNHNNNKLHGSSMRVGTTPVLLGVASLVPQIHVE